MPTKSAWQYEAIDGTWRNYSAPDNSSLEVAHRYYREHGLSNRVLIKLNKRFCIVNFKKMRQTDILRWRRHKMRLVSAEREEQHEDVHGLSFDLDASCDGIYESSSSTSSTRPPVSSCTSHEEITEGVDCCDEAYEHHSYTEIMSTPSPTTITPKVGYDFCPIDPAFNLSTISNHGSGFLEEVEPPLPLLLERSPSNKSVFGNAISEFKEHVDNERTYVDRVQQAIDNMWLTEFNAQVRAELYHVVIESAKMIERGMNSMEVRHEAYARFEAVEDDSLKGLETRASNRDAVAIDGGFEYLQHAVRENNAETLLIVRGLVDQLVDSQEASRVKVDVEKRFANLLQELESISIAKEVNTWTMFGLDESIQQVEMEECLFIKSVVRLAKANPQNVSIQVRALRTLAKIAEVYVKDGRNVMCGENEEDCPLINGFIRDTISAFAKDAPNILTEGVLAAMWCSAYRAYTQNGCGQVVGVIDCITALMQAQASDAVLQNSAIVALLLLVESASCCCETHVIDYQMLLARNPVVEERLLFAMASYPACAQIQEHGGKLWNILKQTPNLRVDVTHRVPVLDE